MKVIPIHTYRRKSLSSAQLLDTKEEQEGVYNKRIDRAFSFSNFISLRRPQERYCKSSPISNNQESSHHGSTKPLPQFPSFASRHTCQYCISICNFCNSTGSSCPNCSCICSCPLTFPCWCECWCVCCVCGWGNNGNMNPFNAASLLSFELASIPEKSSPPVRLSSQYPRELMSAWAVQLLFLYS